MYHFAMLTLREQLVETVLHIDQCTFQQGYMELCGTLEIPGGPHWEPLCYILQKPVTKFRCEDLFYDTFLYCFGKLVWYRS